MAVLQRTIVIIVVVLLALGVLNSGALDSVSTILIRAATRLNTELRSLLITLAIPAVLLGALIAISPKHRKLGTDLAVGGVIGLVIATIGPSLLTWLSGAITTYSSSILNTTP